jgi:hypothetical protein
MSENPENAGPPNADELRETFAETLTAAAEAGRARMRPTPLAEIGALRRRRRTHRTTLVAALATATTCAVAVGVTLAASPAAKKPSLPPGGPTPTIAATTPQQGRPSSPASTKPSGGVPIPARYLTPQELPMESASTWSATYVTSAYLAMPLPTVCNNHDMTQNVQGFEEVRYSAPSGPEQIIETIHDLGTPANAADRLAALTPACGAGLSVHTADGFGWAEPVPAANLTIHMIVARHGKWLAVLEYLQGAGWRAYNPAHDGDVLKAMVDHLRATAVPDSAILPADQVPFPDGSPWQASAPDLPGNELAVTDVCASAWDPVDTTSTSHAAPDSLQHHWAPGNPADVSFASENIHVFASAGDAALEYQKAKAVDAAQTCHHTEDTVGAVTSTITPGGSLSANGAQGFATGRSDSYATSVTTGTFNQFRTYVVLKGTMIAVLSVPVTKDHVADSSGDKATLTAIAGRLP